MDRHLGCFSRFADLNGKWQARGVHDDTVLNNFGAEEQRRRCLAFIAVPRWTGNLFSLEFFRRR
jgi:hypothetical protein